MITKSFDNLPFAVDQIYKELMELKSILLNKEKHPKEYPKHMDINDAVAFLNEQGYKITRSTLYKLTSTRKIPHSKFLGKLVFETKELLTWCEHQLK